MKYTLYLSILFIGLLSGCRKDKTPHLYAGTYDCTVTRYSWSINGGNSVTQEQKNIEILLDGDTVEVFGYRIHEDSIIYGDVHFVGYSYNYMSFHFEPDSIYIKTFSGGLGGGTNSSYKGKKIN